VSDDLAKAERHVRRIASGDAHYLTFVHAHFDTVMAEFDRRGAEIVRLEADNAKYRADFVTIGAVIGEQREIIEAATALVGWWNQQSDENKGGSNADAADLLDALAAAVRTEGT
jgi:hypothetical protein